MVLVLVLVLGAWSIHHVVDKIKFLVLEEARKIVLPEELQDGPDHDGVVLVYRR